MNKATICGRVGKDPEIRSTQSGAKCATFSIATSEKWKDKRTGEKKEKTEWHNIVCWNEHLVSVLERFVHKGDQILIEGKIETRKWQDRDGHDRYSTEIVLPMYGGEVFLLGNGDGQGGRGDAYEAGAAQQQDRYGKGPGQQQGGQSGYTGGGYGQSAPVDDGLDTVYSPAAGQQRSSYADELDDKIPF